jgi:endonuclease/exonuclease/phosphatase family metal-dependent hydrolase
MAFATTPLTDAGQLATPLGSWSFTMGDLSVLAVHPTYPVDASGWVHDQGVVLDAVTDGEPDLVLGDFNATVDHQPLRTLADEGYRDAGELANDGWHPTWPADGGFDLLGMPLAQIDHVLVGDRLAAVDMDTVAVPGSDHRAVVATVARK